jgi:aryl-alcohol dehydrogenase-like predicted oxidoreductase
MLETRSFGETGDSLSIVGMGAIVVMDATEQEARERVAWAVEQGVNYFDVAPTYGNAQQRLGPALAPHRDKVFLACKSEQREATGVNAALEESLRMMDTDHFDLYQLHALGSMEDVDRVFAPGGAMEAFVAARDAGKVRYLGFSAHSQEAALEAMGRFAFDSVLFPVNYAAWNISDFGPSIMQAAISRGVARLALKAMAHGKWPESGPRRWPKPWYEPLDVPRQVELALRWTLSQPVTAALPPGEWDLFRMAVEIAADFRPITGEETAELMTYAPAEPTIFP